MEIFTLLKGLGKAMKKAEISFLAVSPPKEALKIKNNKKLKKKKDLKSGRGNTARIV